MRRNDERPEARDEGRGTRGGKWPPAPPFSQGPRLTCQGCIAMDILILAGQSNMAGRGNNREFPAQYIGGDPRVMCFTAKGNWTEAMEPLHKDVDLRKRHRCGVGPALVCARALLNFRKKGSLDGRRIGLVPCAIGGASLDEWQKQYAGVVGDCEVPKEGKADSNTPIQANAPWGYKPGSSNLFGAVAARAEEALKAAPEGSQVAGMLWYQGETDAMKQETAETYFDRFQTLVNDVRGLGYPDLKFFTVAVTGTTPRLPYLAKVREAQLRAGSSEGIEGVWVADAFGLPMFTDGLHLITSAQVELGEVMARQVFAASQPSTPRGEQAGGGAGADAIAGTGASAVAGAGDIATAAAGSGGAIAGVAAAAIADGGQGWTREEARARRAAGDLTRILDVAKSKKSSKLEATSISQVEFLSFAKTLFFLNPSREDRLLLLGCGAGTCAMASALLYDLREIRGIDLKEGCLDTARELVSAYAEFSSPATTTTSDGVEETLPASATIPPENCTATPASTSTPAADCTVSPARSTTPPEDCIVPPASTPTAAENCTATPAHTSTMAEACTHSGRTPSSSIRLEAGDFAAGNYCDATLVYAACVDIDDDMMLDLARRCLRLREGATVVTVGKPLPRVQTDTGNARYVAEGGDVGEVGGAGAGEFEVAWQCQVEGCWGGPAVAYVHHRVPPGRGL